MLGLLWELARCYPARTLAVGLGSGALVAMLTYDQGEREASEECPFEQTWYDGDVHFNATLVFSADGAGTFATGGAASDAPQTRYDFGWTRDGQSVTVVVDGTRTTLTFEVGRWETGTCWLRSEEQGESPPPLKWGYRLFTNHRGW